MRATASLAIGRIAALGDFEELAPQVAPWLQQKALVILSAASFLKGALPSHLARMPR